MSSHSPLLILLSQELMLDHRGVFWLDSSVRFTTSDLSNVYKQVIAAGGIPHILHALNNNLHDGAQRACTATSPIPRNKSISTRPAESQPASSTFTGIEEDLRGGLFMVVPLLAGTRLHRADVRCGTVSFPCSRCVCRMSSV